jgi:prepilin-type N-terminal cleavage/methylation domain-containing protein
MLTNLKKRTEGFTIIEVLIVLAIAGLILAIVFLAVPALQRSNRNTARRQDVGNLLSAVIEYQANNGGANPAIAAGTSTGNAGGTSIKSLVQLSSNITVVNVVPPGANGTTTSRVDVAIPAKCSGSNTTSTGAAPTQAAAMYTLEGGSGDIKVCLES